MYLSFNNSSTSKTLSDIKCFNYTKARAPKPRKNPYLFRDVPPLGLISTTSCTFMFL